MWLDIRQTYTVNSFFAGKSLLHFGGKGSVPFYINDKNRCGVKLARNVQDLGEVNDNIILKNIKQF